MVSVAVASAPLVALGRSTRVAIVTGGGDAGGATAGAELAGGGLAGGVEIGRRGRRRARWRQCRAMGDVDCRGLAPDSRRSSHPAPMTTSVAAASCQVHEDVPKKRRAASSHDSRSGAARASAGERDSACLNVRANSTRSLRRGDVRKCASNAARSASSPLTYWSSSSRSAARSSSWIPGSARSALRRVPARPGPAGPGGTLANCRSSVVSRFVTAMIPFARNGGTVDPFHSPVARARQRSTQASSRSRMRRARILSALSRISSFRASRSRSRILMPPSPSSYSPISACSLEASSWQAVLQALEPLFASRRAARISWPGAPPKRRTPPVAPVARRRALPLVDPGDSTTLSGHCGPRRRSSWPGHGVDLAFRSLRATRLTVSSTASSGDALPRHSKNVMSARRICS